MSSASKYLHYFIDFFDVLKLISNHSYVSYYKNFKVYNYIFAKQTRLILKQVGMNGVEQPKPYYNTLDAGMEIIQAEN